MTESTPLRPGLWTRSGRGTDILPVVTTHLEPLNPSRSAARGAVRRAVRLASVGVTVACVTALTLVAAPAGADVPEGWSNPADVDMLSALLLLAGAPLLLFVLITLAVYLPAMVRGEKLTPGEPEPDSSWFGGPRRGSRELAAPDDDTSAAGGARGTW